MDYHNTEHAGGSSKNRLVDDVVFLEKGDYILYYVTDGSHSFRRWNAAPPLNRDRWGITVMGADRDFNPKDVIEYSPEEDQSILVKLVGIGDWESTNADLTLQRDGEIHIYALGEGRSGRMFDYAWIEEANTGKVVWEMTYRKTKHAGGARKNREFNDTIYLPAGDYTVYYESDDSHSYKDWNAAPPYDPVNYGITIDKVKD
ncbi:MAG: hypothetical protein GWN16_09295 [Calditrichae bacterium]|nr:hypothetical protein [Calditrichia bacterium]